MDVTKFGDELVITTIPFPDETDFTFNWETKKIYDQGEESVTHTVDLSGAIEYVPQKDDKLYFYPGCDVPRHKVRTWAKKNNASVTIKETNATVRFASSESLRGCLIDINYVKIKRESMLSWIEENYELGLGNISDMYNYISELENKYVFLSQNYAGYRGREVTGRNNYDVTERGFKRPMTSYDISIDDYRYMTIVENDRWEDVEGLLNSPKLCTQDSLIRLINKEAVVIDQQLYEDIRNMFKSTNEEDRVMGIEIMANSNIDPSLHHILLLLQEFYGEISGLKQSNHVNFRSLLEYLNIDDWWNISDDDMVECLMERDVLEFNTIKELSEGIKERWKDNHDTKYFKINTITVSEEVKEYFTNKQLQTVDDNN